MSVNSIDRFNGIKSYVTLWIVFDSLLPIWRKSFDGSFARSIFRFLPLREIQIEERCRRRERRNRRKGERGLYSVSRDPDLAIPRRKIATGSDSSSN